MLSKWLRGKICHKFLAALFVSKSGATMSLMRAHFVSCPVCRFVKAFVVENAENEDYLTNPAFKRPIFFKHIRLVITDGIPIVQKYLDSILKELCCRRKSLQKFLTSSNIGRLNENELKGVKKLLTFVEWTSGPNLIHLYIRVRCPNYVAPWSIWVM